MKAIPRAYWTILAVLWIAGFFAGRVYAQQEQIPSVVALAAGAALLVELSLYAALAFEPLRVRMPAPLTAVSGAVIYMVYSLPCHVFDPRSAALLLAGGLLVVRWYRGRPPNTVRDVLFLALFAAPLLLKLFPDVYARPHPELRLDILGQLFWIRCAMLMVMQMRPQAGLGFGFWPSGAEWRIGVRWFGLLLPVLVAGIYATGFARFQWPATVWWQTAGAALATFFGILWVTALFEEFFCRGLLQQWLETWTGNRTVALVLASLLFGCIHLGFRQFPNYRMAGLAAVAGIFYGLSFRGGAGIRAATVTHALTVTVWKTLFR